MIKQMNLLTQDDPQYGITYYRALKLDPDIAKIVVEPALRRPGDQRVVAARATTYPQARYSQTAKPAYYAPQVSSQPPLQPPPRGSEMTCYGCGEKGHGMSRCGVINEMISKDLLALDIAGRIVHKDGTPIWRMNNETYAQAIERERPPRSHLITVADKWDSEDGFGSDDEIIEGDRCLDRESESDAEDVFAVRDVGWETFVADRPEKKIAARQKMIMEGVYPPQMKDLSRGKENRPADPETGRPVRAGKMQGTRPATIREAPAREKKTAEPMEVDDHEPRYDASKDSQIIEDARTKKQEVLKRTQEEAPEEVKVLDKHAPRKSTISEHVNLMNVLNQVLGAKVELAVGEIIGISRELSGQLSNSIKFKAVKQLDTVGLTTVDDSFRTKTHGLLIKITMECDGQPIQAIIDTGS